MNHKTHLSFSQNGWILIHQGSPLCDYKKTFEDILKVATFYRVTLPEVTWNGDRGEWVTTNTIEEVTV
jgi:hypothetical protein